VFRFEAFRQYLIIGTELLGFHTIVGYSPLLSNMTAFIVTS